MSTTKIFFADGENPKMIEAFENAQKTFKYFWRELSWEFRRIIPALDLACVKIAFTQEIEGETNPIVEHMWINDIGFDGNNVSGILINEPHELTNVAKGDFINVPLDQISDWLFATGSSQPKKGLSKLFSSQSLPKTYGGFTIQVIRSEMSKTERKQHDEAWGLDFGDYNEIFVAYQQKEKPENLIEHPMSNTMKEKLIEFLTTNPNEISNTDDEGYSLLHREAIAGNLAIVETLLSKGADKNVKTSQGQTALDFAKKLNWEHLIQLLEK